MMRRATLTVALAAVAAAPAAAHHSAAMFDTQKTLTLTGTVKAFEWTNPHAWLQIVGGPEGAPADEWSIELTSPNILRRFGWSASSVKPGDKVVVQANPMRDGTHSGNLRQVTLPDGKVLGGQGKL